MRRRDFIKVIAAPAMGWPLAARAQSSTKMARIGMLYIGLADAQSFKKELREALRELGYVEGQNIAFEFRSAEGKLDRLPGLASELVRLKVDVIVALYVPSALAAKQATRDIPIVIIAADPVETGIVPGPGASGRKHYRHISDVCRIQCKKHRTVPGYVALRATCGGIRQHERFCIRESYARRGPTRRWADRNRDTAGHEDP
jgi:ABC transporter substrate binding protein